MLQVLRKGLKNIVVEEVPEPTMGRGEVKIRTAYSLISSGTEIAGLHSESIIKEAVRERNRIKDLIERAVREQGVVKTAEAIMDKFHELSITGYAGAGIIIQKSSEISDLNIGQVVAYGGIQTGHAEIVCAPRNLVIPVPGGVSLKYASLATVGSIALHAIRNSQISIGDTVAVIGLGLIGQLVMQLSKVAGARTFGIDIKSDRVEQALKAGADMAFMASENPQHILNTMTNGKGVDAVLVCASSKSADPMQLAVNIARSRAHVVVIGMVKMEVPWETVYRKELQFMVSRAYGPGSYDEQYEKRGVDYPIDYVRWTENRNMAEYLRLIEEGKIKPEYIITDEFSLAEAPVAFEKLTQGGQGMIGAVLRFPDIEKGKEKSQKIAIIPAHRMRGATGKDGLNVGIIGLGNIARWVHLPDVKKHPKLILKAVCTNKGYKAKHLGSRFGSEYCCTDYKEIIHDKSIDAVIISTRHDSHAKIALEALDAGKHIFVEKPMAINVEDCERIVKKVKETGLGFMVNFNRRYTSMYSDAKAAISGLGPKIITIRMNSPDMKGEYWMMDPEEGGGAVLGEGCHFFDLMTWLTDSDPLSVFARNLRMPQNNQIGKNNIGCTISFEDGSVGNFIYTTLGHRGLGSERVEITVTGASAVIEDMRRLCIWKGSSSITTKRKHYRAEKGYYEILNSFVKGVTQGRDFYSDAIDGAKATLTALAALRSLETGLPEKVATIKG